MVAHKFSHNYQFKIEPKPHHRGIVPRHFRLVLSMQKEDDIHMELNKFCFWIGFDSVGCFELLMQFSKIISIFHFTFPGTKYYRNQIHFCYRLLICELWKNPTCILIECSENRKCLSCGYHKSNLLTEPSTPTWSWINWVVNIRLCDWVRLLSLTTWLMNH